VPAYEIAHFRGTAAELHAQEIHDRSVASIRVQDVTSPALVLGSNQDERIVDRSACRGAGVDVVRRRSGGGAVLLVPGAVTWLDVILPRGAPGWDDDVHRPMIWLGRHLRSVLLDRFGEHGITGRPLVHEGRFRPGRWSDQLCFDGLGAGEITLDGAKLIGIAQRRTRSAARLQCSWYSSFDWRRVVELLVPSARPPIDELAPVATLAASVTEVISASLRTALSAELP
jgi:lipoate-protein ligase A